MSYNAHGRWTRPNSSAADNSYLPSTGYTHSGYQAALTANYSQAHGTDYSNRRHLLEGTSQNSANLSSFAPSRDPKLGPGGPIRCSYPGCLYSGYAKGVEIHRMDRHLIFPPGYKPVKGPPDGDVGPAATIQGTGISLSTPGALEAWIAERKKNWPTDARISEKQKRKAEAIERGEIVATPSKRQHLDDRLPSTGDSGRRGHHRGRGRIRGFAPNNRHEDGRHQSSRISTVNNTPVGARAMIPLPPKPIMTVPSYPSDADEETSSDSGSGSDIDPDLDVISSKIVPPDHEGLQDEEAVKDDKVQEPNLRNETLRSAKKRTPKQPPSRPYDPMIDRPSFLRKLLQPEIRRTVSNLSQAIRFIVDNNMFEGVEIKPGEASDIMIEELPVSESKSRTDEAK